MFTRQKSGKNLKLQVTAASPLLHADSWPTACASKLGQEIQVKGGGKEYERRQSRMQAGQSITVFAVYKM